MADLSAWFLSVDWWEVAKSAAIPVAAILIPTVIAVRLARNERKAAERSYYLQRRHNAAEGVILALAQMISMNPTSESVAPLLRDLRGRIAIYRASLAADDALSGDWLALKHNQGKALWALTHDQMVSEVGYRAMSVDETLDILHPAQAWAHETMESLSGWLSGYLTNDDLRMQGATLFEAQDPAPN